MPSCFLLLLLFSVKKKSCKIIRLVVSVILRIVDDRPIFICSGCKILDVS